MEKKTLIIYPGKEIYRDSIFSLVDPETGEGLASHLCSGSYFAKGDLHDNRPERLKEWREKYGVETEAKFIDETDYDMDEIFEKNKAYSPKEEALD